MLEPWGSKCIFNKNETAFKLFWASNPGAFTHWCAWWIEQSWVSSKAQFLILALAKEVFNNLDWGALRLKQMFAAEVRRLQAQTRNERLQVVVSKLLRSFPEIHELWQRSNTVDALSVHAGHVVTYAPPLWMPSFCSVHTVQPHHQDLAAGAWLTGLRHEKCWSGFVGFGLQGFALPTMTSKIIEVF